MDEEKQVISGCYAFSNWLDVVKDLSEKNKILVIGLVIYSRLTGEEPDLKPYSKHIIPYYRICCKDIDELIEQVNSFILEREVNNIKIIENDNLNYAIITYF